MRAVFVFLSFLSLTAHFSSAGLVASSTIVPVNTGVKFSWNSAPAFANNWILFAKTGDVPSTSTYLHNSWSYTYGDQFNSGEIGSSSGSVVVTSPQYPGKYTAHFCLNNGYSCPFSLAFVITEPIVPKVECLAPGETKSKVKHSIVVLSENHSFDSIFGRYCRAPTGSNPTCTEGPSCCERSPDNVDGFPPLVLSDYENGRLDRPHGFGDEACMIANRTMSRYVAGCSSSSRDNYAVANNISAAWYYNWAKDGAISDRFFQSAAGASCQNDMYFAGSKFFFRDNDYVPQSPFLNGANCYSGTFINYTDATIADLFNQCQVSWSFYAEGFDVFPKKPQCYGAFYDASDDPFTYFPSLTSKVGNQSFRDFEVLFRDLASGTLPSVSYVKALGMNSEHPGSGQTLSAGQKITQRVIDAVKSSPRYAENTVIFAVPDESGGFFDHAKSPPINAVDGKMYGPRTQFVAIGYQTKRNFVSHVETEPSSLVRFFEWNWLAGEPGQLQARDKEVNNLGDLFEPSRSGFIPSDTSVFHAKE